jgi:hypothetical protein
MRYQYAVGPTLESMQYLFVARVTAPQQTPIRYSRILTLGDANDRGTGWPVSEWYYPWMEPSEYNFYIGICPNQSGDVYVRTLDYLLAWHTFRAIMGWPKDNPEIQNDCRMKVLLRFKLLEQVA